QTRSDFLQHGFWNPFVKGKQTSLQTNNSQKKGILIMRHNKFISAAIALCAIGFFTMGSAPSASALTPVPVTITGVYDFTNFPNTTGTFTASGALGNLSGTSTMNVGLNPFNGIRAHCVVTLTPSNGLGT